MAEKTSLTEAPMPSVPDPSGSSESEMSRPGCSFVDAAWNKFNGDMTIDDCSGISVYVPKKGPAKITDSGHMILPWRVHMSDCGITEAGHHPDMMGMCRQVTELDLAHNNITSLQEVLRVIRCMPQLTFLNLTSNALLTSTIPTATTSPPAIPPSTCEHKVSGATDATSGHSGLGTESDTNVSTETAPASTTPSATTTITTSTTTTASPSNDDMAGDNGVPSMAATTSTEGDGDVGTKEQGPSNGDSFSTVRQLVLNDTCIGWPGIVGLLKIFPSLEELHLSLNNYTSVELPEDFIYPSLTRLFFNKNHVEAWSQVSRLGRAFPGLQQLYLAETGLASLDEDGDRLAQQFPTLALLSLNKTQLGGWPEVERLRLLPALTDVRLQGIPFFEAIEEKLRRQQLVARLPNITRLNGSAITESERVDAERAFIRLFMDSEEKPDRYFELEKVYGKLDPLAKVSLVPQTVFNVLIVMDDRREPLEINGNITVRDLKKTLQNLVGLPSNKFTVYYHDLESNHVPDQLRYMDKKLYTYHLNDGDEFIVVPKP